MSIVVLIEVLIGAAIVFGIGVAATKALGAPELVADEPPSPLPAVPAEELTADDLARAKFPLAFRGYRMAEVDETLDRLEQALLVRDQVIAELRSGAPPSTAASGTGTTTTGTTAVATTTASAEPPTLFADPGRTLPSDSSVSLGKDGDG